LTAPGTDLLQGTVYPGGTTRLWLTTTNAGTLTVALVSIDPATVPVRLALGDRSGNSCEERARAEVQQGSLPQLVVPVTAGSYCVDVADLGTVGLSGADFSISVQFE
jgi:hypothetical protein